MAKAIPVKKALLRYPDAREVNLLLMRESEKDFVWLTEAGKPWESGVKYDSQGTALAALRLDVEGNPNMVGVKLQILPMLPPPAERVATKLIDRYGISKKLHAELADMIERETRISVIVDHVETLLGYVMQNRDRYAAALFPTPPGQRSRDLTLEGLILNVVEELERAKDQQFKGLRALLTEPVSRIMAPNFVPRKGGSIQ